MTEHERRAETLINIYATNVKAAHNQLVDGIGRLRADMTRSGAPLTEQAQIALRMAGRLTEIKKEMKM